MSPWEHVRDITRCRVPLGTSRGWLPEMPDHRDKMFHRHFWSGLHAGDVDLRDQKTPIIDQGILGSCVPCSLAAMMSMVKPRVVGTLAFSPLFLYYEARKMLGKTDEDTGVDFRTALKVMQKIGVCWDREWPYEPNRFAWKPSKQCYETAGSRKITAYYHMRDVKDAWTCLEDGFPFAMGMTLYKELYAAGISGILADPDASSKPLGSHAVLVVGHDRDHGTFLCRNSFGAAWGINGHFWMPHYLADWRNAWTTR